MWLELNRQRLHRGGAIGREPPPDGTCRSRLDLGPGLLRARAVLPWMTGRSGRGSQPPPGERGPASEHARPCLRAGAARSPGRRRAGVLSKSPPEPSPPVSGQAPGWPHHTPETGCLPPHEGSVVVGRKPPQRELSVARCTDPELDGTGHHAEFAGRHVPKGVPRVVA